jgi:allantoate deiminase
MNDRVANIISRIDELASISEDDTGITRRYGTPAAIEATNKVLEWMRNAGLETKTDAIGNLRGRWPAKTPHAKTLVIGSHLDTVINAGRWDGPLGVLTGLDILENIARQNKELPFHLELIAFCDEEGVRFHTTYLGSKVVAGSFEPQILQRKDENGIPLKEAILAVGGNPDKLSAEAIAPDQWLGYFEIHIEQGPVLYEKKIPVAPVTAIAGQIRAELIFTGLAGHAGTVPMDMRQDALCGAAEFILAAERLAQNNGVLLTVGKLQVANAASNVIPGEATCSIDLRSADQKALGTAHEELRRICAGIAGRRGLTQHWEVIQSSPSATCDPRLTALLSACVASAGYEALQLVSGAGHDAVPISAVSPVCMLFVRCFKGISHNPLEAVEKNDLAAALAVAESFIFKLAEI